MEQVFTERTHRPPSTPQCLTEEGSLKVLDGGSLRDGAAALALHPSLVRTVRWNRRANPETVSRGSKCTGCLTGVAAYAGAGGMTSETSPLVAASRLLTPCESSSVCHRKSKACGSLVLSASSIGAILSAEMHSNSHVSDQSPSHPKCFQVAERAAGGSWAATLVKVVTEDRLRESR